MLKGFLGEEESYLKDIIFALPFGVTAALILYGIFATLMVPFTGSHLDFLLFLMFLILGSIAISLVTGFLVSRIADKDKRGAVEWSMMVIPIGIVIAAVPTILLNALLLRNDLGLLLGIFMLVVGGLIAWLLGNWTSKALTKIKDERKARLVRILAIVISLFLGLIFLRILFAPLFLLYTT